MAEGALIGKYLSQASQLKLISDLIQNDDLGQVLELIESASLNIPIDSEIVFSIFKKITEQVVKYARMKDEQSEMFSPSRTEMNDSLRTSARLLCHLPGVWEKFQTWISYRLNDIISKNYKHLFDDKFGKMTVQPFFDAFAKQQNVDVAHEKLDLNILSLLDFLEVVYLFDQSENSISTKSLDFIVVPLLGCNSEEIAESCSKLMRWHIKTLSECCNADENFDKLVWNFIKQLYTRDDSQQPWKQKNSLSVLLRFLLTSDLSPELIGYIRTDMYWEHIQRELDHEVHEHKKLALSILKLTIQKLPAHTTDFKTTYFTWSATPSIDTLNSWKKFTTLYEMIALDTSLNQIEAAKQDVIKIFDNVHLHPSWGLILLSTGLKSSMESVRKYVMKLMFSVTHMSVFSSNIPLLTKTLLPAAMLAHYFSVKDNICPHGERLSSFVKDVLAETTNDLSELLSEILRLLVEKATSFDPSRIYVSYGILEFLQKNKLKAINSDHLNLIRRLYEFEGEDGVLETTIQTIYLKLLLYIDPCISASELLFTLLSHIKYKKGSYQYVEPLFENYRDLAVSYFDDLQAEENIMPNIGKDAIFDLLALVIFDFKNIEVTPNLLIEIAKSKQDIPDYTSSAITFLTELLSGNPSNGYTYENATVLLSYPSFTISTWKSLKVENLFESVKENFSAEKFKFFAEVYKKINECRFDIIELKFDGLLVIYELIKTSVEKGSRESFKVKDSLYSTFFDLMSIFLRTYALNRDCSNPDEDELHVLLHLIAENINKDNGNFLGNLAVCNLMYFILDTYIHCSDSVSADEIAIVKFIFERFSSIWESVCSERLVLKERDLQLSLIGGLFHPAILYFGSKQYIENLTLELEEHAQTIISLSYTRRSLLPLLGSQLRAFMKFYGDSLNEGVDFWWLINILVSTFKELQMDVNLFKLKPVISHLYDRKLNSYYTKGEELYEKVYGPDEVLARVSIIDSILYANDQFKVQLIEKVTEKTNVLHAIKRTDGAEALQRLLQWQLLLLSLQTINEGTLDDSTMMKILKSIEDESSPLVRVYKEWFISTKVVEYYKTGSSEFAENYLFSLLEDHSKPVFAVSAEKICFLVLKELMNDDGKYGFDQLLDKFLCTLVPNAASNKPLVRHFSNSLVISLWPAFESYLSNHTLRSIIENLYINAKKTQVFGEYRTGDANIWDLKSDKKLTNMFGGVAKKITDHNSPYISEAVFEKYLQVKDTVPIGIDERSLWLNKRDTDIDAGASGCTDSDTSPLQTKSGAWETVLDLDNKKSNEVVTRSDLIVVSSLVDKPPNLGGICRLCDVLGVGLLTVQDIKVKSHPQFKNVAVTADRWMPMEEVALENIASFMKEKKKEGYTLIGLEQTDKSLKLDNSFRFPKKSLILLGTEAFGIPGPLLSELDLCLEIQQFGVIRSMNIQTATAVIVHSYTVQHM
ncbi:tRNA (guanosine(18)-2'-O)-methyltransferase [Saccharomyces eubayanus]|uniref:tRNA (guanosine(18)-2'-O)-methyltransferase n=1 Tax=Saccharomyces eubayanus TaxID=1080349 RepID=UPI0006C32E20|nr:TRM3-like protein [Saccharomyces eubayanus]KOH00257.1 TRM3-like protein [Saccharomyces eubayanus]